MFDVDPMGYAHLCGLTGESERVRVRTTSEVIANGRSYLHRAIIRLPHARPTGRVLRQERSTSHAFLGRTDNIRIRFAGASALVFNVVKAGVAMIDIVRTVRRDGPAVGR